MLEIKLEQYSGRTKLYKNTDLKIKPGVTVLLGPNRNWKNVCMLSDKRTLQTCFILRYGR